MIKGDMERKKLFEDGENRLITIETSQTLWTHDSLKLCYMMLHSYLYFSLLNVIGLSEHKDFLCIFFE